FALLQACSSPSASSAAEDAPASAIDGGGTGTNTPTSGGGGGGVTSDGGAGDAGSTAHDAASVRDADTSTCPMQTEGGGRLPSGSALAHAVLPNPIVSLGRPVTTTTGGYDATQLFAEPQANAQAWQPANGESVTIDVGAGPSELLIVWQIDYPDYVSQGAGF